MMHNFNNGHVIAMPIWAPNHNRFGVFVIYSISYFIKKGGVNG